MPSMPTDMMTSAINTSTNENPLKNVRSTDSFLNFRAGPLRAGPTHQGDSVVHHGVVPQNGRAAKWCRNKQAPGRVVFGCFDQPPVVIRVIHAHGLGADLGALDGQADGSVRIIAAV